MDPMLPLEGLDARLPTDAPFTRATALREGVSRGALERMVETGSVRRLLRGVYAAGTAALTTDLRAAAVSLVAPARAVVVDRTAAWLAGVEVHEPPVPLDVVHARPGSRLGAGRRLAGHDLTHVHGLRVTTPLRTALDLGRLLPPEQALASMDALVRVGGFPHAALLAELPRMAGHRGIGQLRLLAPQVDPRADGVAESILRLRWHEAALPTATPSAVVAAGHRLVRLSLVVDGHRFGAALSGRVSADELVALEGAGWRIVVLSERRVLTCEGGVLRRHLEREFHRCLVAEAEGW